MAVPPLGHVLTVFKTRVHQRTNFDVGLVANGEVGDTMRVVKAGKGLLV